MEPSLPGFEAVTLIDGERVDSTLELAADDAKGSGGHGVVVLTDRRVILLDGAGKFPRAAFASLDDIDAVEVSLERRGLGAYLWAALAFLVAIVLYLIIDNTLAAAVISVVVALMGVYLVVDRLMTPGTPIVAFRTPSSQLRCDLESDEPSEKVYSFINRLFQLRRNGASARHGRFTPR